MPFELISSLIRRPVQREETFEEDGDQSPRTVRFYEFGVEVEPRVIDKQWIIRKRDDFGPYSKQRN